MEGRRKLALYFLAVGGGAAVFTVLILLQLLESTSANPLVNFAVAAVALIAVTTFGLWQVVDRLVLRRLGALAGEARVIAHGTAEARVPLDRYAELAPLPRAINELGEKLAAARSDIDHAVTVSTARVEEQKSRLSTLLRDLH